MKGISFKKVASDVHVEEMGKNGYCITEEGVEYGIFFRNPIQRVLANYDTYLDTGVEAWTVVEKYKKSPLYRLLQNAIGNKRAFVEMSQDMEDQPYDVAGHDINELCSPIYTKRVYRKSSAMLGVNNPIKSVKSYGFEGYKEYCSGSCEAEKTVIIKRDGGRIVVEKKDQFHYTYAHIIKEELLRA